MAATPSRATRSDGRDAKPGEGAVPALSSLLSQVLERAAVDPVANQDLPLS